VARRRLTGALLVGGASTRFGSPKALARIGDETLAERAWRVLGDACDERIAVGKAGELDLPFAVIDDGSPVRAALAGIVAGLRAAANPHAVFVPVDLPRLRAGTIRALGETGAAADPGPLPATFARTHLPVLARRLAAGELRIRDAVAELRLPTLAVPPHEVANVNEPADLDRLRIRIRPAHPDEGERLREIAIAAKSHWGYDLDRVRAWAADGDFTPDGLRAKDVYVAEADGRAIAWAALVAKPGTMWLDDLWVEPDWIGEGIGSGLFHHVVECARTLGGEYLEWEAELNAVGFYEKLGARRLRDSQPSEWGRVLPVMGVDL
jgi:molybdopterin-guanine dinucleotide biosynthesis protein A/GNAT superfamily N-acetyltransferase